MPLPNPGMTFTPFDPLPASDLNDMVENIESLADGTGISDDVLLKRMFPDHEITNRILNYVESSDLGAGVAISNNTWTDIKGNQNFTVADAGSIVLISPRCGMICGGQASGGMDIMSRIVIDSAGTPRNRYMGANRVVVAGQYSNPWAGNGAVAEVGLSAGVHTIKFQIRVSYGSTGANWYLRAGSVPEQEYLACDIVELKR